MLGAHVLGRAHDGIGLGHAGIAQHVGGDTEIHQQSGTVGAEQHIIGFDIAMDKTVLAGIVQRAGQLAQYAQGMTLIKGVVGEALFEAAAGHVLHGEIIIALMRSAKRGSSANVGVKILMATCRSKECWVARNTWDMPPLPSRLVNLYPGIEMAMIFFIGRPDRRSIAGGYSGCSPYRAFISASDRRARANLASSRFFC